MKLRTLSRSSESTSDTSVSRLFKKKKVNFFSSIQLGQKSWGFIKLREWYPGVSFWIRISVNKKERKASCNSHVTRESIYASRSSEPVNGSLIITSHFIRALIRPTSFLNANLKKVTLDRSTKTNSFYMELHLWNAELDFPLECF